ncbi:amidohydrolase family protein [Mycobacteroides abscessus]|uniref:amidohydrolase family protein n=1 Tax=Mycobacteroides abscessus TaxID=36809 RepID=UPI0009A73544|nr:amidohydrolase family protein [Mycobacteroides abscessus]MDO3069699.1 amidohydrolase family protein [Mycobacteroides abscessus subsp. bolletii]SKO06962.1 O-pyrocatechuate decarboxylase [Mycobacteroides abscessus subsp. bolletii]SKX32963.1 O-pyrocatechuate decarboxylase [Mycobacteroides abscessus subsp. bolletii]
MLPKIALEEAFYYDQDTAGTLGTDPADIAAAQGLEPEWFLPRWERLTELGAARIAAMDEGGVRYSILSHNAPGLQLVSDPTVAVPLARDVNDFLAEAIRRYPNRLGGFAQLPTVDPARSADELRRAVTELGFHGALVNGYTDLCDGVQYLDEAVNEPLWAALHELDVPLYVHPRPAAGDVRALQGHPELAGATWAFAPETATHLLRIIFSGVLDRYPEIKIVVGHLGEGLPAFLGRVQHYFTQNPFGHKLERTLPEYFSSNIHLTTSGNFNDQALIGAVLGVGADNIMFSVDYPFAEPGVAGRWLDTAPISESDRRKIAYGNAMSLLGLTPELLT